MENCTTVDHVLINSGHKTEYKHGIGILLTKQLTKSMMGFMHYLTEY